MTDSEPQRANDPMGIDIRILKSTKNSKKNKTWQWLNKKKGKVQYIYIYMIPLDIHILKNQLPLENS
jgi:hypothetical protein